MPWSMAASVAFSVVQLRVTDLPCSTAAGSAVSLQTGGPGGAGGGASATAVGEVTGARRWQAARTSHEISTAMTLTGTVEVLVISTPVVKIASPSWLCPGGTAQPESHCIANARGCDS